MRLPAAHPRRCDGAAAGRPFAAALIVLALAVAAGPVFGNTSNFPTSLKILDARVRGVDDDIARMDRERMELLGQVRRLSADIEAIKASGDPSFLERRRLERLLAESQEVGRRLEQLVAQIEKKRAERETLRSRAFEAYSAEMERAAEAITATKDRDAIVRMTKYFIALRDARETYRSSDRLNVDEEFLSVTAEPDDTAADLAAKLDLLNNRLGRVNALIKTIDGQIGALKQDLDLSNQMRNLVNEYNLFEDGVVFTPGPRSVDSDRENDAGGPSAGEGGAEPLPTEDIDRAGVHISPIEGLGADRGAESMTFSIEEEIERLKNLRTYMEQVRRKLADQIDKIRRAIRAKGGVPTGSLAPAPERRMEGRT